MKVVFFILFIVASIHCSYIDSEYLEISTVHSTTLNTCKPKIVIFEKNCTMPENWIWTCPWSYPSHQNFNRFNANQCISSITYNATTYLQKYYPGSSVKNFGMTACSFKAHTPPIEQMNIDAKILGVNSFKIDVAWWGPKWNLCLGFLLE